jgi:hypothetical protein
MVAAIVIPMIFLYFLYITMKERKRRIEKWQQIGDIKEETFLSGKVIQSLTRSKRFVGKYYISETTLLVKRDYETYKAILRLPITPSYEAIHIDGETLITCYGYWDNKIFYFGRYKINEGKLK